MKLSEMTLRQLEDKKRSVERWIRRRQSELLALPAKTPEKIRPWTANFNEGLSSLVGDIVFEGGYSVVNDDYPDHADETNVFVVREHGLEDRFWLVVSNISQQSQVLLRGTPHTDDRVRFDDEEYGLNCGEVDSVQDFAREHFGVDADPDTFLKND